MDIRVALIAVLLTTAVPAAAQMHSATGPKPKPIPAAPKAAHNSMAKSTTPFNCEQHRRPKHPHPGVKPFCDQMEANVLQDEARRAGWLGVHWWTGHEEAAKRLDAGVVEDGWLAAVPGAAVRAYGPILLLT